MEFLEYFNYNFNNYIHRTNIKKMAKKDDNNRAVEIAKKYKLKVKA